MTIVYKITNKINGKFYIGKTTKTLERRFYTHKYAMRYKTTYLYSAMHKYGIENFEISLIEHTSDENLDEREQFWISTLKPQYNLTKGGEGGDTSKSPNYIEAMKKHHENRPKETYASYGMRGKKNSEKFHAAIKEANSCPIMCDGMVFNSIGEAEKYYKEQGIAISIRKRIDSPRHPDFYRLRPKIARK